MKHFLESKKILFITTKYHGYEKEILRSLKKFGACVDFYFDDPLDYLSVISPKVIQQFISPRIQDNAYDRFRSYLLKKAARKRFDFVFVLKGSLVTIPFLTSLRKIQPDAVFIQYQWDSLANYNYQSFLPFFDFNFSFDHKDALQIDSLNYLPMFARDDFYLLYEERQKKNQDTDILFVGANHSNRMIMLRGLRRILQKNGLTYKFYIYLPFLIGLKGAFISRKLKFEELMLRSVSKAKLKKLLLRSRFVLDLPSPNQAGVTPRALEALAAGCMLITTDKAIKNVSFFNENVIHLIDSNNLDNIPQILKQKSIVDTWPDVTSYSLTNWIKIIFSNTLKEKVELLKEEHL